MILVLNDQILLPDSYVSCITSHFRLRISHLLIFCYRHGEIIHSMLFFLKKKKKVLECIVTQFWSEGGGVLVIPMSGKKGFEMPFWFASF
jgi:hypothetical protein